MAAERLHVRNFAGIAEAELELGFVTVLIGPQASGKSVCAKLCFFFKESLLRMMRGVVSGYSTRQLKGEEKRIFLTYFPPACWGTDRFSITYSIGDLTITVRRSAAPRTSEVDIVFSRYYESLITKGRNALKEARGTDELSVDLFLLHAYEDDFAEKVWKRAAIDPASFPTTPSFFIPAGRSFFATVRSNVFTLLSRNVTIDPFLAEFGRLYEWARGSYPYLLLTADGGRRGREIEKLLSGTYVTDNGEDYIKTEDGRRVPLASSSSGQQELLPLLLTLVTRSPVSKTVHTLFIEEPEAHLYPTTQRAVVHLIASISDLFGEAGTSRYVITTHSPYILVALNNLMYGGKIVREKPRRRKAVTNVLGTSGLVDPSKVRAYALEDGRTRPIIDPETELVQATLIDRVSGDLASEFEKLVDIEFEG